MSREIKFRVWDNIYKNYEDAAENWFGDGLELFMPERELFAASLDILQRKPERYVIEQFTGLKDSQGKDIYEGDLITFQRWDDDTILRGPVWWDTEAAAWAFGRYIHQHCDEPFDWGYPATKIRDGSIKVVGNIHENIG